VNTTVSCKTARWQEIHTQALVGFDAKWYAAWEARALGGLSTCNCRKDWHELTRQHPPPLDGTPDEQFRWAWKVHDAVSERINADGSGRTRKRITLPQAYSTYRRSGEYERDVSYLFDGAVDVVIPYCDADKKYVGEAVASVLASDHVTPTVHVVYDAGETANETARSGHPTNSRLSLRESSEKTRHVGCTFAPRTATLTECYPPAELVCSTGFSRSLPPEGGTTNRARIRHYTTPHRLGPYRIANAIAVHHASSKYLALNDADDTSTPDRLWRQLATMQRYGYEMTSGSMVNFVDGDEPALELRRQREGIIESGRAFRHVPHGRCINSIRTVRRDMFLDLGGFTDSICSVDFDFDNRAHYAGVPVFWGTDIVGNRRLHSSSLTNGPEFAHLSQNRQAANQLVLDNLAKLQANPTRETARELGCIRPDDRCDAVFRELSELLRD
jgi:hypothetical protein